ncbi:hypothetical protein MN116_003812 [Schistosoma mekongi]|uniref:TLC domain-containing protein n=1 Tax=Schistosoma mekongi TaxID=38744 RepID=A0AAE2D647_SCHME|nr:hypothetical protein MN116_003812 [Schistosoma mekongi]
MYWHGLLPPLNVGCGTICIVLSVTFFNAVDYVLRGFNPPTAVASKGSLAIWKWRNMVVSWLHAILIGTWDILCFYYYPDLMHDPVEHVVPFTYYMVAISTGYFMYDFWDMCTQRQVFRMWELTLHHFAVLSAFIYNVLSIRYIAYTIIALLAEVNSIFLHTRKLMQMHKVHKKSLSYRFNAVLNLLTFAGCRGFALLRISYGMYMNPEKMTPFYTALLGTSMLIMNLLNPVLFYILLRNDFLLPPKEDKDHCARNGITANCHPSENKISAGYSLTFEINGFPCDGLQKKKL